MPCCSCGGGPDDGIGNFKHEWSGWLGLIDRETYSKSSRSTSLLKLDVEVLLFLRVLTINHSCYALRFQKILLISESWPSNTNCKAALLLKTSKVQSSNCCAIDHNFKLYI